MKLLVIEDDPALLRSLAATLREENYAVDTAADGEDGLFKAREGVYDAIVLDVMLPKLDGWGVLAGLRPGRVTPVLMLTARDAVPDRIKGLNQGADDYLTKPFSGEELLARCAALTRRHQLGENHQLRIGSLILDRRKGTASRAGRELQLNTTAMRILRALAEAHPRPLSRSELVEKIWGEEAPPSDPLRTHLHLLRKELDGPDETPMLLNIHGVGYRLDEAA